MLLHARQDVTTMIHYSAAAANDVKFSKQVNLAKGSVIVLIKDIGDYSTYNRFSEQVIIWVTSLVEGSVYTEKKANEYVILKSKRELKPTRSLN